MKLNNNSILLKYDNLKTRDTLKIEYKSATIYENLINVEQRINYDPKI